MTPEVAPLVRRHQHIDVIELVQVMVMWISRLNPSPNRREMIQRLGALLTAAATGSLFEVLDPDEQQHVMRVISDRDQTIPNFDEPTLRYCEGMVMHLARQDNVLGPQFTLYSTRGHQQLAQQLAKAAPEAFQARAISAYAQLTRLMGWLCFNMGDYQGAQHYYDDARSAAHDAQNVELVTYILCAMSQLATKRGKPRIGIDHAAAAAVWAEQSGSPLARGYAAEIAVKAYAADHQPDRAREKLDAEYAALHAMHPDAPRAPWWYFYDESCYWRAVGQCELTLQHPEAALQALDKSLTLVDPLHLHNKAIRQLFRAEARIQQEEIAEAAGIVGTVAEHTAAGRSHLITGHIISVRNQLVPWERTKPVRELDERLVAYRPGGGKG